MMRRLALVVAVVALAGVAGWMVARHWRPSLTDYPVQGIDVGAEQGAIDWHRARADGVDFAYVVATDGTARDPRFAANWAETRVAGLRRGAMHRWSLCLPAEAQTTAMLTTVPRDRAALPMALSLDLDMDCADPPSRDGLVAGVRRFIAAAETHQGKPVIVKLTRAFEDRYAISADLDRRLWAVGRAFPPDYMPWVMWQASDGRRVDGVDAPVRWDVVAP